MGDVALDDHHISRGLCRFQGFSEAAIGVGRLFGMTVPENFRAPLLPRSLQDLWNRLHISLARRVSQYLVKLLTRRIGKLVITFVLAFVVVGLWHRSTVNYLLWGFGHGARLAIYWLSARSGNLIAHSPCPPSHWRLVPYPCLRRRSISDREPARPPFGRPPCEDVPPWLGRRHERRLAICPRRSGMAGSVACARRRRVVPGGSELSVHYCNCRVTLSTDLASQLPRFGL